MDKACSINDLRVGDTISTKGSVMRFFTDERFMDKPRPAVVVWIEGGVVAAPLYTTNGERPAKRWEGPHRIGVLADRFNRLREPMSQFGIANAFVLQPENLRGRFGHLSDEDREIARHEFLRVAATARRDR